MKYWQDLAEQPGQLTALSDPTDQRAPNDEASAPESTTEPASEPEAEPEAKPAVERDPESLAEVSADVGSLLRFVAVVAQNAAVRRGAHVHGHVHGHGRDAAAQPRDLVRTRSGRGLRR